MPRPLTRQQQLENRAFLRALRRTGNVREAARALGAHRAKFTKRRASHPAFAVAWDAALVIADAALSKPPGPQKRAVPSTAPAAPNIHRTRSGRLQLRRAQPGRLDHAVEQRFLAALSASANVRLAAAAAGLSHSAFYQHRRRNPGFAREWLLAMQMGYERLEMALLESGLPESFAHDDWRRNDPPAMPPITPNQALQLMYLHQKEARLWTTPLPDRLRPGETRVARNEMMHMIREARDERARLAFRIAEAERLARGEDTYIDWAAEGVTLPDLSQVKGWSKASGQPGVDDSRALFGGWRVGDMKKGDVSKRPR